MPKIAVKSPRGPSEGSFPVTSSTVHRIYSVFNLCQQWRHPLDKKFFRTIL